MSNTIITGRRTRLSYANLFEPRGYDDETPKYSVSLIIPKDDTETLEQINRAVKSAYENGAHKLRGSGKTTPALETLDTPLNDGDKKRSEDPAYANCWYINAKNSEKPKMFDAKLNPITERSELYSGCYARAKISFFCYNHKGHKGIGTSLLGLQKVADGEPLGGAICVADDFAEDGDDFLS